MLLKSILLITLLALNACTTTQTHYISAELTRPARPVLPNFTVDQAQKIDQASWSILVTRHRLLRQYAEQLEVIIDGTKGLKKP